MGGGNETPRQKMVGMMYLVLTALLALNVSKAVLEAFVAIEENIQVANENEYARGEERKAQLEEVAKAGDNPQVKEKAKKFLKDVEAIDKITAEMILFLDESKLEIMTTCGEFVTKEGKNQPGIPEHEGLIAIPYDKAKAPCKPIRMNLSHVQGPDKYDEPMLVMGINESVTDPKGRGKDLWEKYNKFRNDLTELVVKSASTPEKPASLKCTSINEYKDIKDLDKKVDAMFKKGKVPIDEYDEIRKIYISLTKNEKYEVHEVKGVHWVGKTWDHNPQVAGIASLSSLENEILTARADAISLIRSRVGGGDYSFNKVMSLATGPLLANSGDEVELKVLMAAFDSDKQPVVKVNGGGSVKETKDGAATVVAKVSGSGEMKLSGTVSIAKKSGEMKTETWEHTIKIMKPEGTVSLPDMQVLYNGYQNKVKGVASGYDQTILNPGPGLSLSKTGDLWIAVPSGGAKKVAINISGKNSVTNKTVQLGSFEFKVKPLPPAAIYFAGKGTGESAPKTAKGLSAKFPPSVDLTGVNFRVLNWKMDFKGRQVKGNGDIIDAAASALLAQAKPGDMVTFICQYTDGKSPAQYGACSVSLN
jgi:hypothetical protein